MTCRFIVLVVVGTFAVYANAAGNSCDFTKLNFGISQEQLKKSFNIEALDVAASGEGIINVAGRDICKDLPEKSTAELVLIDDNFVQLEILMEYNSGELLAFATSVFDKQDNKKKLKKPKTALWNKKNQYSVMYNSYVEGRYNFERILITSEKHKHLFEAQNTANDRAYDEEDKKGKGKP